MKRQRVFAGVLSLLFVSAILFIAHAMLSTDTETWAANNITWQPAVTGLPDTGNAEAIVFEDLNGDGKLDLLAGHGGAGIKLWLNQGDLKWQATTPLTTTGTWYGLATGDLDHDGLPDVAACDGTRVYVFLQDGKGGWTNVIPTPGNSGEFYEVAIGDVNDDGILDIVAARHDAVANGIQIWFYALGDWGVIDPPTAVGPFWGIALGDFNNDGHLDIAAGKEDTPGGVYAWRGNGAEVWYASSSGLPDGSGLWRDVAFGDFNNDGKLDLAATGDQGIHIWTGNGGSAWTAAGTALPTTGSYAGLDLGDLNNDGWLDLAGVRTDGNGIEPYQNYGISWELLEQPDGSSSWWGMALADVDNDGLLDLGATGQDSQGVVAWADGGTSEPAGNWQQIASPASSGSPYALASADLNWDGYLDIVAALGDNAGIGAWAGDGGNAWVDCNTMSLPNVGTYAALVLVPLTFDANPDLIAGSGDDHGIIAYQNAGCYWTLWGSGLPTSGSYPALAVGDIDHDGKLDLVGALSGGGLRTWEYTSTTHIWAAGTSPTTTSTYGDVALGDLNLDGELDIAAANYAPLLTDSLGVRIWLYDGATSWAASVVTPSGQYAAIALGDLNNDGKPDIAAARNGSPDQQGIHLWLGDGTGSAWTLFASPVITGQYNDLALADFNHDGFLDILAAREGDGVDVWAGDGTGNWIESSTNLPTTGSFISAHLGHIDHDGMLDLLATQSGGGIRLWTANEATPPGNWGSVSPVGWLTTQALTFTTQVMDSGSGLDVSTARYSYSTDGGGSWSAWLPANISGADGVTTTQAMTTPVIAFGQDSGTTHLNRVRFRIADMAGNLGESPVHNVEIDSTPPGNPTTLSGNPIHGVWSNDPTPVMNWSGATDASSGVRGYSYLWSTVPDDVPDDVMDTINTTVAPAMPGEGSWYFHVRTLDWAGHWASGATHQGPFLLDTMPPGNPTSFDSNPSVAYWSNNGVVSVNWSGASDGAGSGIYGYSYEWSTSSSVLPDTIVETTATNTWNDSLSSGFWYLHIRTRDQAGNWSSDAVAYGPFYIDVDAPASYATSPGFVSAGGITVNFVGSDSGGSGILFYDAQYRDITLDTDWVNWKNNTTLSSGYMIGAPGHIYEFRCRAKDVAGNVEPWPATADTTTGVKMVDFQPFALEVTQAVQDLNNSVQLVANKRTFARLHVQADGWGNHGPMEAKLSAWRGSIYLGTIAPNNPGGTIIVRQYPNRGSLDHSFYFDLPTSWLNGTVRFYGEIDPNHRWADTNEANNIYDQEVTFLDTPEIEVILFDVFYNMDSTTYHVNTSQQLALASWLRRVYPVPDVHVQLASMGPYNATWTTDDEGNQVLASPTCELVDSHLLWHKSNNTLGLNEPWWTRYYGMVSDAGVFMRGCAQSIPSVVASGPAWSGNEWYGSHELGHTYNQEHARGTYPPPCGDCDSDACGPWGKCGCEPGYVTRYPNGEISPTWDGSSALFGFDIETIQVYPPRLHDIMTYCSPKSDSPQQWIADYTYEGIRAQIVAELGGQPDQIRAAATEEYLAVFGTIYTATRQVELDTFYRVPDAWDVMGRVPGEYSIRLLDSGDGTLADYPFTPRSTHLEPGPSSCQLGAAAATLPAEIAEFVPWVTGTVRIAIHHGTQELAARTVSAHAPQVTLTSPNGGEVLDGSPITVTWTASDADGDSLEFTLEYSVDGGAHWQTMGSAITASSWSIDAGFVPGTDQGRFRIVATDGVNTARDASDGDFSVPNKAPIAEIVSPFDGAMYAPGASVGLVASTIDVEDGSLEDAALAWTSSISGTVRDLGIGHMVHITDLITGTHVITLTATDSDGQQATATVTIHITREGAKEDSYIFLPVVLCQSGAAAPTATDDRLRISRRR